MFGQVIARSILKKIQLLTTTVGLAVMHDVIAQHEEYIEQLQREQWQAGQTNEGTDISPDYANSTKIRKAKQGKPTSPPRLHDKGNFYKSVFVQVFTTSFTTDSNDPKAVYLKKKYPNIFGLNPASKQKLLTHIKPAYIRLLKQRLSS